MSEIQLSLLGVHISAGVLADPWLVGGYLVLGVLLAIAAWRLPEEAVSRIGVLSAAFFVSSQVHIPLGVASVHLILNGLVGVMLGHRAPLAITVGLFLQSVLLGHGGLDSLGVNGCIVSIPAVGAGFLYPRLRRLGVPGFVLGCLLGFGTAGATVLLNFFVLLSGGKERWDTLATMVLVWHIPVAVVEGLILGVVVRYLEKVKPEMLAGGKRDVPVGQSGEAHQ